MLGNKCRYFRRFGDAGLGSQAGAGDGTGSAGKLQRILQAQASAHGRYQAAAKGVSCACGVHGFDRKSPLQNKGSVLTRAAAVVPQGDNHCGHIDAGQTLGNAAVVARYRCQLAFVHDQYIGICQQLCGQVLRRCCIQYDGHALCTRSFGIGNDRFHGGFQLQQEMREPLQAGQVFRAQLGVGAGGHGDGVFGIVRHANECRSSGMVGCADGVQLHVGAMERGLQRHRKCVISQAQQHVRGRRAGPGTGYCLVGTLATWVSFKVAAQNRFPGAGDVMGTDYKVQIRRASYKYHWLHFLYTKSVYFDADFQVQR